MPDNIELFYSMANDVNLLMEELVTAACLFMLCRGFTKEKYKAALAGVVYIIAMAVLYYIPYVMHGFTAHNSGLLLAFVVFAWLDRKDTVIKGFLLCTFGALRWAVYSAAVRAGILLSNAVQRIMSSFFTPEDPTKWGYYYADYIGFLVFDLLVSSAVLYFVTRELVRRLSYGQEDLELHEILFMLIPSVSGLLVYGMDTVYLDAYERKSDIPITQSHPYMDILHLLCCVSIIATILVTIALYQDMRRRRDEECAGIMLDGQMRELQAHISEVEKLYTDIRGVKHDIKNHVEIINSLISQGRTGEVEEYAGSLSRTVEGLDLRVKSGNPVTDVIIHEKMGMAEKLGISFASDFHYPADAQMDAFDISVILSNALSNAIEAAGDGGFVRLSSFRNKNTYLVMTENSFRGHLVIDESTGLPETAKKGEGKHGFGLRNIRSVADKYHGDVLLEQKDGTVVLTVMLEIGCRQGA